MLVAALGCCTCVLHLIMTHTDLSLQTETALMYDAALLFATALGELDRSQDIETAVLSCDSELTWQHGNSLINYMKLVSSGRASVQHVRTIRS